MKPDKVLLDSQILIWLIYNPEKVSQSAVKKLEEAYSVLYSLVSIWELGLKFRKGKLKYSPRELLRGAEALGVSSITIELEHLAAYEKIILSHKDPFDALLVAQNKVEQSVLLTSDRLLLDSQYHTIPAC